MTRFQSVLVPLIDGVSAHRYQTGVEGERGPKKADQQKMEPSRARKQLSGMATVRILPPTPPAAPPPAPPQPFTGPTILWEWWMVALVVGITIVLICAGVVGERQGRRAYSRGGQRHDGE